MTDPVDDGPVTLQPQADTADDLAAAALALARRFSAGATLWCVAPSWPEQARHVAVEFVHPVIVGSRALPAVQVGGPALVDDLRALVRPGDVLCAVSGADDPTVLDAFRRAPAWGAMTIWIGAGRRPPVGAADHVLWELVHVLFEQPGVLDPEVIG